MPVRLCTVKRIPSSNLMIPAVEAMHRTYEGLASVHESKTHCNSCKQDLDVAGRLDIMLPNDLEAERMQSI